MCCMFLQVLQALGLGALVWCYVGHEGSIASVRCLQDYLFQYRAGIEAVTPEDVLAAARRCAPSCCRPTKPLNWAFSSRLQRSLASCQARAARGFACCSWAADRRCCRLLNPNPDAVGVCRVPDPDLRRGDLRCRHLHPAQQTVVIIADVDASGVKAKLEKQGRKVRALRVRPCKISPRVGAASFRLTHGVRGGVVADNPHGQLLMLAGGAAQAR